MHKKFKKSRVKGEFFNCKVEILLNGFDEFDYDIDFNKAEKDFNLRSERLLSMFAFLHPDYKEDNYNEKQFNSI